MADRPRVVIIGGPNGAGKSTSAPKLLRGPLKVPHFVNADVIARGLSEFAPEAVAAGAGRIMLARVRELGQRRISFAFETTLASRSFAAFARDLKADGYEFYLLYIWVPAADFAIARVAQRVQLGGHFVPDDTVTRRYRAGMSNFFELYQPLATRWPWYNNSMPAGSKLVASGKGDEDEPIYDRETWQSIRKFIGT
jgi:predicted ABC-type ATPase